MYERFQHLIDQNACPHPMNDIIYSSSPFAKFPFTVTQCVICGFKKTISERKKS